MKKFYLSAISLLLLVCPILHAQVSINTDGSAPDNSSILDVKSTEKGLLMPRMSSALRTSILTPATGLVVYDTDENSFFYFDGVEWVNMMPSGGGGFSQMAVFNTSGTWNIPAGVSSVMIEVWGGGGGGGGHFTAGGCTNSAGGGGGGAYGKTIASVTPGNSLTVTIGTGGTGGSSCICPANTPGLTGNNGTNSTVTDHLSNVLIDAGGGQGGASAPSNCTGGAGGSGGSSSAQVNISGANGTNGIAGNASVDPVAGFGGQAGGGGGSGGIITPRESASISGVPNGKSPGGGGSGSNWSNANGANGANGRVIIYY